MRRPEIPDIPDVDEHLARRSDEACEPRMARADDAPDQTKRQQSSDAVAYGDMHALDLVARRKCDDEERH